jgi:hypothetical protein
MSYDPNRLYRRPAPDVHTRWASFENPRAAKGAAARENRGAKGHPFEPLPAGESVTLVDVDGPGIVTRLWLTVSDRSPTALRALRIDAFWDGAATPAVSAPLGDFFGVGLPRRAPFESALFSDPEGRSFCCLVPMPFRTGARIVVTNEGDTDLKHLFYDADLLLGADPGPDALYFHTFWHRESPNVLGAPLTILPHTAGVGRYLGCSVGVRANPAYGKTWWGEGELKVWLDGDTDLPTLCGSGAEDLIGTAWGLERAYSHQTQGCPIADTEHGEWSFYRYHTVDPVYFHEECRVALDTYGGGDIASVRDLVRAGVPLIPITIDDGNGRPINLLDLPEPVDLLDPALPAGWCNFWRQDDWSAVAYFYLDRPENGLPALAPVGERTVAYAFRPPTYRPDADRPASRRS